MTEELKIIACYVTKNESERWLNDSLAHVSEFVDDIFIYDDQSDDCTVSDSLKFTDKVLIRPDDAPSFVESESELRENAWNCFESTFNNSLDKNTWILALDADEFFVGCNKSTNRDSLQEMIRICNLTNSDSCMISISEIWKIDHEKLFVRTDGFWAKNSAPRLFRYKPNGVFLKKKLGCGSTPTYAVKHKYNQIRIGSILHFGYVLDEDKKIKYKRYSIPDSGHNKNHIDSIMLTPKLVEYHGRCPKIKLVK